MSVGSALRLRSSPSTDKWRAPLLVLIVMGLSGCASDHRRFEPSVAPPNFRSPSPTATISEPAPALSPRDAGGLSSFAKVSDLNGWGIEDHLAAFTAFRSSCRVAKDAALHSVCMLAQAETVHDDEHARLFFERHFRVEFLPGEGVLTGYFAPVYPARGSRDEEFSAAVRPLPPPTRLAKNFLPTAVGAIGPAPFNAGSTASTASDLTAQIAGTGENAAQSTANVDVIGSLLDPAMPTTLNGQASTTQSLSPQAIPLREADRTTIEATPAQDAVAWMRPEDLFFMQI